MMITTAMISEIGPRDENQDRADAWILNDGRLAVAIADGLGGHIGGSIAAEIAIDHVRHATRERGAPDLKAIAFEAHEKIRAEQLKSSVNHEMATTLSAAIISDMELLGAHCGDTRILVTRGDEIARLTQDHTELQLLLDMKLISPEDARFYPRRNVLHSALGIGGAIQIDEFRFALKTGDRVFFCSDGIHDKIDQRELHEISEKCASADDVVSAVQQEMIKRRPSDNYTLVCCILG